MDVYDFHSWLQQRTRHSREHVPAADRVVPMVVQAGAEGLTRSEIGKSINLERDELDRLLAGLVEFGLLSVTSDHGLQVFRYLGRIDFTNPSPA